MKRRVAKFLALLVCAASMSGTAYAAPRLMQGAPALGEQYTTQIIVLGTTSYEMCSAAVWKPRVLLTAAHCLTDLGGSTPAAASRIFVMPPGVNSPLVYATGPVSAARVRVIGAYLGQQYVESSKLVIGNDIAAVVLDSDLSPSVFTRLADRTELDAWVKSVHDTTIVGYGITSLTDTSPSIPRTGTFILSELQVDRRNTNGWVTWSNPVNGVDTCPGDSGAPQFVTTATSTLLIGDIAGGNCTGQQRTAEGFAAITYLEVLNPALLAAGYPAIPSAPQEVTATSMNGSTTVWWASPRIAPESAVNFEVRDERGAAVCASTQPYCTFTDVSNLTLRSKNTQGEGDAVLVPTALPVRPEPPRIIQKNGLVKFIVTPLDYPVITGYRIIDKSKRIICRITNISAELKCSANLGKGPHRFTVSATTPQGRTPESPASAPIKIRF
ncbi:MAG: trypsin-like serine protease [Actinomycetes bacterium]